MMNPKQGETWLVRMGSHPCLFVADVVELTPAVVRLRTWAERAGQTVAWRRTEVVFERRYKSETQKREKARRSAEPPAGLKWP